MASNLIRRDALLDSLKESKEGLRKIYDGLQYENEKRICSAEIMSFIEAILRVQEAPAVDAEPVRHGRWILEAHDERVNYRWNVTAMCSECCDEKKEIWAGFFPGVFDCIARDVALQDARNVKLSNYCPNCGAKMDGCG